MGGQQNKIGQTTRNYHKPKGFDLMQNCDLPPPSKVFMGPDKSIMYSMNRVFNISGKEDQQDSKHYSTNRLENGFDDDEKDKMELLKALQASQTRAREAEKKVSALNKERDGLSIAFLEEAMYLFGYRQQVRLLELQVLNMQSVWLQQQTDGAVGSLNEDGEETTSVAWVLALIFSLGIGVATALACRY